MKNLLLSAAILALGFVAAVPAKGEDASATKPATAGKTPLGFTMKDIDGRDVDLAQYKGNVILFVNVASKCGNTPQYTALETLYQKYKDKGFTILAFPANNFGGQEPGAPEQIKEFCTGATSKYHITFPLFGKISVKGDDQHPLYQVLQQYGDSSAKAGNVTWNFEKFLVGRDGTVVGRFTPKTKPDDAKLIAAVEKQLEAAKP